MPAANPVSPPSYPCERCSAPSGDRRLCPTCRDPRRALAMLVGRCRSEGVGTSWDPLRHAEDVLREGE